MDKPNQRLIQARIAAGFPSAEQAASRFHWVKSTYHSHENGQTSPLPRNAAKKYGQAFKVSYLWLLYEADEPQQSIDEMLQGQPPHIWDQARQLVTVLVKPERIAHDQIDAPVNPRRRKIR